MKRYRESLLCLSSHAMRCATFILIYIQSKSRLTDGAPFPRVSLVEYRTAIPAHKPLTEWPPSPEKQTFHAFWCALVHT